MNLDNLVKYIIWIIFFMLILAGLYFVLGKLGVV